MLYLPRYGESRCTQSQTVFILRSRCVVRLVSEAGEQVTLVVMLHCGSMLSCRQFLLDKWGSNESSKILVVLSRSPIFEVDFAASVDSKIVELM